MAKRVEHPSGKVRTTLGREVRCSGNLRFKESLKIEGYFTGTIESLGFLMVEADAVVKANVRIGTLIVGGTVEGNVHAEKRLEILAGGKIIGDIRCPNLVVADGTELQGKCEMLADPAEIENLSMPLEQLKKVLKRVG